MMLEFAILTVFPFAMLLSAHMDLFTMTIPNKVSLLLIAGFFVLAPFVGLGWQQILIHTAVAFGLLLICMSFFAMGWIGGGDAKLFAATGLWLGFSQHLFEYALLASLFGGALTLLIMNFRNNHASLWLLRTSWLQRLHDPNEGVPYGIALALAGLLIYPQTAFMTSGI